MRRFQRYLRWSNKSSSTGVTTGPTVAEGSRPNCIGFEVTHNRVLRMMLKDNLLGAGRYTLVVRPGWRNLPAYENMARHMESPKSNQLGVAEIHIYTSVP